MTDGPAGVPLSAGAPVDAARLAAILRAAGFEATVARAADLPAEQAAGWDLALGATPPGEPPANLIALPLPARAEEATERAAPAAGGELPGTAGAAAARQRLRARAPAEAAPAGEAGPFTAPRLLPSSRRRTTYGRHTPRLPDAPDPDLRVVYAALPCGAALIDESGSIRLANAALHELLGAAPDDADDLHAVMARLRVTDECGADLPREAWATRVALRTGRPVRGLVACIHRPDGM
mgnify:CR=1 FL=1